MSSVTGLERSPGGEHGNPLQYSCLENPMDRGNWLATSMGVTKGQAQLSMHTLDARIIIYLFIHLFIERARSLM